MMQEEYQGNGALRHPGICMNLGISVYCGGWNKYSSTNELKKRSSKQKLFFNLCMVKISRNSL